MLRVKGSYFRLLSASLFALSLNQACDRTDSGTASSAAPPSMAVRVDEGMDEEGADGRVMRLVSDGRTTGNRHFYFLAPTVWQDPKYTGKFDKTALPEVTVCALDASNQSCSASIATFNMTTGPEKERIKVEKNNFNVNWKTKNVPNFSDRYRIHVRIRGQELGYTDVKFVKNLAAYLLAILKDYRSDKNIDFAYALRGQDFPIKFRIEEGAVPPPPPIDESPRFGSGNSHSCFVDEAGDIYCAGYNVWGQLGLGVAGLNVLYPAKVVAPVKFTQVALGDRHTCAIDTSKKAWCWGLNMYGQLGTGSSDQYQATPQRVLGNIDFKSLDGSNNGTCGVAVDGNAWCWGYNGYGNVGNGTASYMEAAPVKVSGTGDFKAIAASTNHTCGLKNSGEAYCWGFNVEGVLGSGNLDEAKYSPVAVSGGLLFTSIGTGEIDTCGLAADGRAYCWGNNSYGQIGDGSTDERKTAPTAVAGNMSFKGLSSGYYHNCALDAGGTAFCWGFNAFKQAYGNTSVGDFLLSPLAVEGGLHFQKIYASLYNTCAQVEGGSQLYCWGSNEQGLFGNGQYTSGSAPEPAMIPSP